jgi:zinc transport system ATP-binding protein
MEDSVVLRFSEVGFSYKDLPVLHDVNFHVHAGEFIALVGPNGSGKTTLLKLLLGLERPDEGKIQLLGKSPRRARSEIGYVPQHMRFDRTFPITVRGVVRMGRVQATSGRRGDRDREATDRALSQVDLSDLAERPYGELSGGQRRRVLVARALAADPRMLILDEPTANMDVESESRLYETLGKLKGKTTIVIVTHDMSMVSSLTDRVFCIGAHKGGGIARTVVQHTLEPVPDIPELHGGGLLRVQHEIAIPGDVCERQAEGGSDE